MVRNYSLSRLPFSVSPIRGDHSPGMLNSFPVLIMEVFCCYARAHILVRRIIFPRMPHCQVAKSSVYDRKDYESRGHKELYHLLLETPPQYYNYSLFS